MPRRTMTVNRVWYHPLRKTNVEDWGQVRELPDGRDLLEVFVDFAQSDIDNDSLVREDRESYAVVTGVERQNRAVIITTESGRFGEEVSIKDVRTHQLKGRFTPSDATVVVTHGVLLVPKSGNCALAFCERSAGQGGMTALLEQFEIRFNALYPGHRLKKATVVQQSAWLKRAQLKKVVGTVRKYNADIASDGEEQVVGQLTHSLVPEEGKGFFSRSVWEKLRDRRISRAKFLNFAEDEQIDTFEVTVTDGSQTKTFDIGDERTPPLRLVLTTVGDQAYTSTQVLGKALDEAAEIFADLGIEWSEADAVEKRAP